MPTPINQTLKDAERLTRQVTGAMTEHAVPAARKLDVDRQAQGKAPYKKADSLLATSVSGGMGTVPARFVATSPSRP